MMVDISLSVGDKIWFHNDRENVIMEAKIKKIDSVTHDREVFIQYTIEWIEEWYEEPVDTFSTVSQIYKCCRESTTIWADKAFKTKEDAYKATLKNMRLEITQKEREIRYTRDKIFKLQKDNLL